MIFIKRLAAFAALGALLGGCTSNQAAVEPSYTPVSLASTTTLQFAVGTANLNGGAAKGLNTVVTFRQNANGLAGALYDNPTITGPVGFVVNAPASVAGIDSGTNQISSPTTIPASGVAATPTSFGTSGGAFNYGFAPANSSTSGAANYSLYREPFYTPTNRYVGGPPAFPFVRNGTFPSGFAGYSSGFTIFDQVTLATGTYSLSLAFPSSNVTVPKITASGTLNTTALLPPIAAPVVAHAGANGASITFTVPAGCTEAMAYVYDSTTGAYYTAYTNTTGANTLTIPDNLGIHGFNLAATPTFNAGDVLAVTVVGFDYPAFEAAPPANTSPNPAIVGANGQADLTQSPQVTFSY